MTNKTNNKVEEIVEEIKEMFRLNNESGGYNPDDISRIEYLLTEFRTSSYEQGVRDERERVHEVAYNFNPDATYRGQDFYDCIDSYLQALKNN